MYTLLLYPEFMILYYTFTHVHYTDPRLFIPFLMLFIYGTLIRDNVLGVIGSRMLYLVTFRMFWDYRYKLDEWIIN